ncbi:SGNH hydrolase domain-containing protein, partial [Stenotrophomonas sp. 3diitr2024]|uniref:SGNH hydrolase domain-containing protein n=1 Tax=Stenotrophomonas sp. 3diitr2024 TaxID=3345115 RepID=UPI0035CBE51F
RQVVDGLPGGVLWDPMPVLCDDALCPAQRDGRPLFFDGDHLSAHGNPSHTGVDDLEREYSIELQARMMLYHYASVADGQALAVRGHRVA